MSEELRAIDLADADADENTHRCDHCERPGRRWLGGAWLCGLCWLRADGRLLRELQ